MIKENSVVQKIMITLPAWFNSKVSVLEDISDLDDLTKDELYGILKAYEIRTKPENVSKKESTFTIMGNPKSSKSECRNTTDLSDKEEANFMRRLKRIQCKYKGQLPFKCFKCGRIRHFDSKCTHEENRES